MAEHGQSRQGGLVEYHTHYLWAVIVTTIFALILIGRFFQLQIVRGEEYERRSRIDHIGHRRIPARRGVIRDRKGALLARNVSEHSISVVPHYLEKNPDTLPHLRELLGLTHDEYAEIARKVQRYTTKKRRFHRLTVMRNIVSDHCPADGAQLELGEAHSSLWCPACGAHHEVLGRDQRTCRHDKKALEFSDGGRVGRCPECGASYVLEPRCPADGALLQQRTAALTCPNCERVYDNQVAIVTSHLHELPGLRIDTKLRRRYPERFRFSHLLGYMNEVNARDLKRHGKRYRRGDYIGRAGLERSLEGSPLDPTAPNLRGEAGEEVYLRDRRGMQMSAAELSQALKNLESTPAQDGDDVWLTVDAGVQKIVERAMRRYPSGGAVVLEVHTGRVLAAYSKPEFDPNVWSGRLTREAKREYDENEFAPMINKALTAYAPGSVWKVITAIAALEEGVVDADTQINCPGYYEFGGRRFKCHKHSGHGDVNLRQAMMHSCDVYFYIVGETLGMDRLERYSREVFAMGLPTGIELFERAGRVPSKDYHRKYSRIGWQPGFTLSTAVGQGAVLASPLQIARLYATLANGGRVMKNRVVLQLTGKDGQVRRRYMPEVERVLGVAPEHLALVHQSLLDAVNAEEATGREARISDILVAGKTGTAEAEQFEKGASEEHAEWLKQDHAWFAAYAPADDPQISVAVFLEHAGGGGKHAAPVARRIIEQYFRQGFGELPESETVAPTEAAPTEDLDGIR